MKSLLYIFLFFLGAMSLPSFSRALTLEDTVYISRGEFETVKQTRFPYLNFSRTVAFSSRSTVLELRLGDTLALTLINKDTANHSIRSSTLIEGAVLLAPKSSASLVLTANKESVHIIEAADINDLALGLAMTVSFSRSGSKHFHWNFKSHQSSLNEKLVGGQTFNRSRYEPDYFTINGLSFPDVQVDPTSKVIAGMGDTVLISVTNTGFSTHSVHFHGFHCVVRYTSSKSVKQDWIKDTFPVRPGDSFLLEFVPDKVGRYSVHDHNLIAVSGGGTHPNGMFTIMEIK